ncbi:MAG: chorismate mutase [Rhodobacteraceae bacterium]|nr:chorismate mutase [Paracoccaceae bacterium]
MTTRSKIETDPKACASMAELRLLIDALDADLVGLLRRRQACIDRAAELKPGERLPARIPTRIDDVLAKVRTRSEAAGLDPALSEALWRTMIEWAIAREERALARAPGPETE